MDTNLNLPAAVLTANAPQPLVPRAMTSKVHAVDRLDQSATLPANKPFVAQVVTARLSGADFPENPGEIAPPDRTLRPYDVPMLPFDSDDSTPSRTGAQTENGGQDTLDTDA